MPDVTTWSQLRMAWRNYRAAKTLKDKETMKKYAERIRSLQEELGVTRAIFPDLGLV